MAVRAPFRHDNDDDERDLRVGILVQLGLMQSGVPWDIEALDRRLDATLKQWPTLVAAIVLGSVPAAAGGLVGIIPFVLVLLTVIAPLLVLRLDRSRRFGPTNRLRMLMVAAGSAGVWFGQLFGTYAGTALGTSAQALLMISACFVVVVALARLPVTSIAFTLGLAALIVLALPSMWLVGTVLLPTAIVTVVAAATNARLDFADSRLLWRAEQDASRPSRLLDEIEARGSAWFWETDRRGRISYISSRIAQALGASEKELIGRPLSCISDGESEISGDGQDAVRSLSFLLTTRTAFSDHVVRAASEEEIWWSLSGRPIYDRFDQLRGFIGIGTDLTAAKRSQAEVSRLARFDALTGLPNRAEIGALLKQAIAHRGGATRPSALLLLDLDRFKSVNDTLGHPAGDALLTQVAQRLVNAVGTNGHVGRLGGDEFQIVMPATTSRAQVDAIAKALIESVSRPYQLERTQVSIGVSVGIAMAPDDGRTVSELTRNADLALYAAKSAGRGVNRFYDPAMHAAADRRHMLETALSEAVEQNALRVVYQPVVSCKGERVTGFEALVRWTHPVCGPISPAEFIPIAEESSLIERVGEWVLRRACAEAASWPIAARIAVNVSPTQFANPSFPTLVAQVLAQTGLAPQRLELEITEGVFMAEDGNAERQFETLKRLGVRLALDDFGTGYSSLGYLQRAPLNKIKIDQSFVLGATQGTNQNAAIIRSIVALADALGMETTAEGAETEDEIELIRSLGCSHIQGFYYGPPMEVELLRERMNVGKGAPQAVGHKKSRSTRISMIRNGRLSLPQLSNPVRLRNISTGGVMVEVSEPIAIGTRGHLEIQDGPTVGVACVWWEEGRAGFRFDEALDLSRIAAARSQPRRAASG